MRTVLLLLMFIIALIVGFLVWPVIWIARIFSRNVSDLIAYKYISFCMNFGGVIAGLRFDIRGRENLPKEASVYVINHRSFFDIIALYKIINRPTGFIAKDSIKKVPIFSYWLKLGNGLFLKRDDLRQGYQVITQAIANIKRGVTMAIFPEGTRNKDYEHPYTIAEFHPGSFKLAERTNAPLVPITLIHTEESFEKHKPWLRPAKIKITIGKPIRYSDYPKEEQRTLYVKVRESMEEVLKEYEKEEQGSK